MCEFNESVGKVKFGEKLGFGSGYIATEMWKWCGLCVVMLGVVGILSGGRVEERGFRVGEEGVKVEYIKILKWKDGQKQMMWGEVDE